MVGRLFSSIENIALGGEKMRVGQKLVLFALLFFPFILACFWVFGVKTKVQEKRIVIFLKEEEKELVLREMRELLRSVNMILYGISTGDYDLAHRYAKSSGMDMVEKFSAVEKTLLLKLPDEFKKLGFATHKGFDEVAELIKSRENQKILSALAELTSKCVACHDIYSIQAEK
ncbi:hypothetical protein HRbin19_00269 [bacterium HR19]|nr:hypothetical protein HRbin19_00269 [bacterium HR19]